MAKSGTIIVDVKIHKLPSLMEVFCVGKYKMPLLINIDFTASNGLFNDPNSLHFVDNNAYNPYQVVIDSFTKALSGYSINQLFPSFGFGAQINGSNVPFFPLNGNIEKPECEGLNGVLQTYDSTLKSVELYGPDFFSPVLQGSLNYVKTKSKLFKGYFISLVITDGNPKDVPKTKKAIIEASKLPMSIIIIGVGDKGFDRMKEMMSNVVYGKESQKRQVAQFLSLSELKSVDSLVSSSLKSVKQQVIDYIKLENVSI